MDPLDSMSPEDRDAAIQQLLGVGMAKRQQPMLEDQMARVQALRRRPQVQHSTGLGAGLGGIGDILSEVASLRREKQLQEQMQKGLGDEASGFRKYFELTHPMNPEAPGPDEGIQAPQAMRDDSAPYYVSQPGGGQEPPQAPGSDQGFSQAPQMMQPDQPQAGGPNLTPEQMLGLKPGDDMDPALLQWLTGGGRG